MFKPVVPYVGNFELDKKIYTPDELLSIVANELPNYVKVTARKHKSNMTYYNVPAGFDTEATSLERDGERIAAHVSWQFGINGHVCIGRTYDEFHDFHEKLNQLMHLNANTRLIVYVHNLAYEFAWFCGHLNFTDVFSSKPRSPIYAYEDGWEWKDSLILTGCSLEKSAENLTKYHIEKLHTWDYSKVRHHLTHLNDEEKKYAAYDVLVVMAIIKERMEQEDGFITSIPMTRTGYVRRDCRLHTRNKDRYYKMLMDSLKITPEEYIQLKRAFMGGFTHANHNYVRKTLKYLGCYDFTSSYPAVMVMEKFPMGRVTNYAKPKTIDELECLFDKYCVMCDIILRNVKPKVDAEHLLSDSKCICTNAVVDNGRIVSADEIITTITDVDYWSIKDFYEFDSFTISSMVVYRKEYLPKLLIERILHYYIQKTTLKGVKGKEVEYNLFKEMVNSIYGMMVMDIYKPEITYFGGEFYDPSKGLDATEYNLDVQDAVGKYNKSRNRFLYYPWGVWVTAYARRNLLRGIIAAGDNYVYSDTDSIKYLYDGSGDFRDYVKSYNEEVRQKMETMCQTLGFPLDIWRPKTVKGKEKPLGYWDAEEPYMKFKTLGAKRYLVQYRDKSIVSTVAGSNKKAIPAYLDKFARCKQDPFEMFDDELYLPPEHSMKLGSYYLTNIHAKLTDCYGVTADIDEPTCCCLLPISFSVDMSDTFLSYLSGAYDTEILC